MYSNTSLTLWQQILKFKGIGNFLNSNHNNNNNKLPKVTQIKSAKCESTKYHKKRFENSLKIEKDTNTQEMHNYVLDLSRTEDLVLGN